MLLFYVSFILFQKKNLWTLFGFLTKELEWVRAFCKKGVLKSFTKFTGKHVGRIPFFSKMTGLRPYTLLKKETLTQVFSCEFFLEKFLKHLFEEHLWWLLVDFCLSVPFYQFRRVKYRCF